LDGWGVNTVKTLRFEKSYDLSKMMVVHDPPPLAPMVAPPLMSLVTFLLSHIHDSGYNVNNLFSANIYLTVLYYFIW